ncbi:MAG TPA: helicase-related protein, partial [Candidatus Ozemobacteraceae bacterium]|nr:helicase-related protein [Candidatus Ozemobacteraceae bacterium]
KRLAEGLKRAEDVLRFAPGSIPDPDDLDEMEDTERERIEAYLEAVTLANNADQVRSEIAALQELVIQAKTVEDNGQEAKLKRLKALLEEQGFFDHQDKRLLIFTEFKDTLDYLMKRLKEWGFTVGCIHGGMKPGSRDEPGTRLHAEQQFREGAIQVLVATEAAGEGINLQVCHILFNYDIPWNPNRLEQRMGRIHRYGQEKDCLIFNFVAGNTIEGRVLQKLLEKLQEIRDALEDDAVFNVVGEVLPAAHIERVLRDYYAGKLGELDLEDRLLRNVDERDFRNICQNALEGLASKKLNLAMLVERRALAQERRVVPETIARFLRDAGAVVRLDLKPVKTFLHAFDPGRTPDELRRHEQAPDWKLPGLASRYPRFSTDRETSDKNRLEWVTPGHPLFEAVRREVGERAIGTFAKGACYHSLAHENPVRIDLFRARVVDGLGQTIHERLFAVENGEGREPLLREASLIGNLSPGHLPEALPPVAFLPEPMEWLQTEALSPFLEQIRTERAGEIDRIAEHIELSLSELLIRADLDIGRAAEEVEKRVVGAEGRLAMAENTHQRLVDRRDRRRRELEAQRSLTLQGVERLTSFLVLPHPERAAPEVTGLRQNLETEAI